MLRPPLAFRAALVLAGLLLAGCSCPPLVESYVTPHDTLAKWQAHLCRDDPEGEYSCLAASFQAAMGGFPNYYAARTALLEQRPVAAWLLQHADLEDYAQETSYSSDGRGAAVRLQARGETVWLRFEREAWVTILFADGTSVTRRQVHPMDELLGSQAGRQFLFIDRPALTREQLDGVRSVHMDSRWLIADLAGLAEGAGPELAP